MAATFAKFKLSGSTNGEPILVTVSSPTGTVIHTSTSETAENNYDEIWLWGFNSSVSGSVQTTIEYGGVDTLNRITVSIPSCVGLVPLIPGLVLHNSAVVRVYASTPNVVTISGFVNRILDDSYV